MSPATIALLSLAAFVAGGVDAIGGGGGLLTLPALLWAGLPPHLALGTNKGISTWGTAAATATFGLSGRLGLRPFVVGFLGGAVGALVGARLQLLLPPSALRPVVLVLLMAVAIGLALYRPKDRAGVRVERSPLVPTIVALVIGAYDGFFGPGTGTFLIVANVSLLGATLAEASAEAKAVNLGSNVASLATFALRGTVLWTVALPMAAANVVGGVLGARLAVRKGDRIVRLVVILVSLSLVAKLAWDLFRRP